MRPSPTSEVIRLILTGKHQILAYVIWGANRSLDRILLGYETKKKVTKIDVGSDGLAGLTDKLEDDKVYYGLVRMLSGDRESKRVKFVFIVWVGDNAGAVTRGRVTMHKGDVATKVGVRLLSLVLYSRD